MRKPYVILSNDDGIRSKGLQVICRAVSGMADVLIAAPDREKSGSSHSLSVIAPIKAKKAAYAGAEAYSVKGTPVDCAKIALYNLARRKPSLFISGINHGPNIAQFILYSGTIGAAAEAAILGIPALAFSIDSYEPKEWAFAADFIKRFVKKVLCGAIRIKKYSLLNVNLPHAKPGRIKGVKLLPGSSLDYTEKFARMGIDRNGWVIYRHIIEKRIKREKDETDSDGVMGGYVTITPLKFDLNDPAFIKILKKKKQRLV